MTLRELKEELKRRKNVNIEKELKKNKWRKVMLEKNKKKWEIKRNRKLII